VQDAGRRERGERIRAVHELHRALANVTRTGTSSWEVKPRRSSPRRRRG
jgi:hypothetical protein